VQRDEKCSVEKPHQRELGTSGAIVLTILTVVSIVLIVVSIVLIVVSIVLIVVSIVLIVVKLTLHSQNPFHSPHS